jgi:formylglycine-generating enzyme required for sulfatase activity
MNEFELGIRKARAKQRKIYALSLGALFAAVAGVVMTIVVAGGTPIKVLPPDAETTAKVVVAKGVAFAAGSVVYSLTDTFRIVVSAHGFHEQTRSIEPHEQGKPIAVTLVELPGRIAASTSPASDFNRWLLNGALHSLGHALDVEISAGSHKVALDNPYFEKIDKVVDVTRGETISIEFPISPVSGSLQVQTEPSGGFVKIDNRQIGESPVDLALEGGRYKIVIEREGYAPVQSEIEITNVDRNIQRRFLLKPHTAKLTISVAPPGGELLLGGRKITPNNAVFVDANAEHNVTYFKNGYIAAKKSVTLNPNEESHLSIKLEREFGDVELWTSPKADVYVGGKKVGTSPGKLRLPAVPLTLEIRKEGYRSVSKKIRPSSRQSISIREQLTPELAARLKESPNEYTNSVGIELKLFKPTSFEMGAPRHQQGQRANEFEKAIDFRKAFYAAKHEVTNSQFMLFKKDHAGVANEPVSSVHWLEAAAFCNWLSAKEGLTSFYVIRNGLSATFNPKADGYRMLSEAEWEWLARRAGKREQTVFPWGDKSVVPKGAGNIADEAANGLTTYYVPNYTDGFAEVAPVASFPPEPSGLFDLTGNVAEFVHDFYALQPPRPGEKFIDPLGPNSGDSHVIKGSSWRSGTRTLLRAAYRDGLSNMRDDVGFRIGRYLYGAE